jgi:HD-GYP domain-containing protein (c-di-GMP phosphodiesterase class II)
MTSDRSYRRALPHAVALGEIKRCSGSQFDPSAAADFQKAMAIFREAELAAGKKVPG